MPDYQLLEDEFLKNGLSSSKSVSSKSFFGGGVKKLIEKSDNASMKSDWKQSDYDGMSVRTGTTASGYERLPNGLIINKNTSELNRKN